MAGETIVVIDDEPYIIEMLSTFLKIKGYIPHGATTGSDGLILIDIEKPHAVLLDLMLPDIPGEEVLRRLRTNPEHAALPVLVITARTEDSAYRGAMEAGANGIMHKPVSFPTLIAELQRVLGG